MNQFDLNIEQWRNEIATFVDETKRELNELQTILARQFSEGPAPASSERFQVSTTVANQTELSASTAPAAEARQSPGVNQQLADLKQAIAKRLQIPANPAATEAPAESGPAPRSEVNP